MFQQGIIKVSNARREVGEAKNRNVFMGVDNWEITGDLREGDLMIW